LPVHTKTWKSMGCAGMWNCDIPKRMIGGSWKNMEIKNIEADTEANARAKMLIYLIENKLLESEE